MEIKVKDWIKVLNELSKELEDKEVLLPYPLILNFKAIRGQMDFLSNWQWPSITEEELRRHFINITNGEGPLVPRVAVKVAIDNLFSGKPIECLRAIPL